MSSLAFTDYYFNDYSYSYHQVSSDLSHHDHSSDRILTYFSTCCDRPITSIIWKETTHQQRSMFPPRGFSPHSTFFLSQVIIHTVHTQYSSQWQNMKLCLKKTKIMCCCVAKYSRFKITFSFFFFIFLFPHISFSFRTEGLANRLEVTRILHSRKPWVSIIFCFLSLNFPTYPYLAEGDDKAGMGQTKALQLREVEEDNLKRNSVNKVNVITKV